MLQLFSPKQVFTIDLERLKPALINAINTYLDPKKTYDLDLSRKGFWHGKKGKRRANNFKTLLQNCPSKEDLLAILLALFGEPRDWQPGRSSNLASLFADVFIQGNYRVSKLEPTRVHPYNDPDENLDSLQSNYINNAWFKSPFFAKIFAQSMRISGNEDYETQTFDNTRGMRQLLQFALQREFAHSAANIRQKAQRIREQCENNDKINVENSETAVTIRVFVKELLPETFSTTSASNFYPTLSRTATPINNDNLLKQFKEKIEATVKDYQKQKLGSATGKTRANKLLTFLANAHSLQDMVVILLAIFGERQVDWRYKRSNRLADTIAEHLLSGQFCRMTVAYHGSQNTNTLTSEYFTSDIIAIIKNNPDNLRSMGCADPEGAMSYSEISFKKKAGLRHLLQLALEHDLQKDADAIRARAELVRTKLESTDPKLQYQEGDLITNAQMPSTTPTIIATHGNATMTSEDPVVAFQQLKTAYVLRYQQQKFHNFWKETMYQKLLTGKVRNLEQFAQHVEQNPESRSARVAESMGYDFFRPRSK